MNKKHLTEMYLTIVGLAKIMTTIIVVGIGFGLATTLSMKFDGILSWFVLMGIMLATIFVLFEKWGLNILKNTNGG